MTDYTFTVLVPRSLRSLQDGRMFLRLWSECFHRHKPKRFGVGAAVNRVEAGQLDHCLAQWGNQYFVMAGDDFELMVNFGAPKSRKPRHASITALSFKSSHHDEPKNIERFLCLAAEEFGADYAMAQILTRADLEDRYRDKAADGMAKMEAAIMKQGVASVLWHMEFAAICTATLRRYLPDMYWMTIFGKPYVNIFGMERLKAAPALCVKLLSAERVFIRLTETIDETLESWQAYKVIREGCKLRLDSDTFRDVPWDKAKVHRVPEFVFPASMYVDSMIM